MAGQRAGKPRKRTTAAGGTHDSSGPAPRLPRTYVARQRLFERLDRAADSAVTLLVAPAGAGKTLGVSGWVRRSGEQERGLVWLHADRDWRPERLAAVLDANAAPDGPGSTPRLVVVDDAHELPEATVRFIDERLNADPESLRLLLLSRWDLSFARLVPELLGHFTILRGGVLRMDDDEAAALIVEHSRSTAPEVLRAVTSYAQGWCAAIVLTSRAVGSAPDPVAAATRYAREETPVADRVASEVFATLHPRQRHLLLCTAAEPVVDALAAVRLTHDADAGEVLADLEATGLLVTRLGHDQTGTERDGTHGPDGAQYRIHPLLAEVVRRRLASGGVDVAQAQATVSRAVRLDLAAGDSRLAFHRLLAVGEHDLAADVLAVEGLRMVLGDQGASVASFVRRHGDVVERHPRTWFVVALERWSVDDTEGAHRWLDRVLDAGEEQVGRVATATARLMRSRLGLEPLDLALREADRMLAALLRHPHLPGADQTLLPLLMTELGIGQNWLGELAAAELNLTTAMGIARSRDLAGLAAAAASHLAFTEYMAGRERGCAAVAGEVMDQIPPAPPLHASFARHRAELARLLAVLVDVPLPTEPLPQPVPPARVHTADLTTRFWIRMRDARLQVVAGSVAEAQRELTAPLGLPVSGPLPAHLQVALLVERAFLAALASDQRALRDLEEELLALDVPGEGALVAGLWADLAGDRRAAASRFAEAAEAATYRQPPSRALALTCQAQLLDVLGEPDAAIARLREAAGSTEVRRSAVAFLGWSRQGTPMATLLARLGPPQEGQPTSWAEELAAAADGRPDVVAIFSPTTATVQERESTTVELVPPLLSPREREVLNGLGRGATYADIAASLFVSENTVKTHVSSLYGKLAASRRSEALAVARRLNLL